MDEAFWLDNLLSACAALSAIVLAYGGWLTLAGGLEQLRDWLSRRLHGQASRSIVEEKKS